MSPNEAIRISFNLFSWSKNHFKIFSAEFSPACGAQNIRDEASKVVYCSYTAVGHFQTYNKSEREWLDTCYKHFLRKFAQKPIIWS